MVRDVILFIPVSPDQQVGFGSPAPRPAFEDMAVVK
jgi:hypothetical protein